MKKSFWKRCQMLIAVFSLMMLMLISYKSIDHTYISHYILSNNSREAGVQSIEPLKLKYRQFMQECRQKATILF